MNVGIITSFIIGGLLLISMLTLNNTVMLESSKATIDITNKAYVDNLRDVITHDFNRIGFGQGAKIVNFLPPDKIIFQSDIYGQGTKQVIWQFKKNTPVNNTSNPNDRVLMRIGPIDSTNTTKNLKFRAFDFKITTYKDKDGTMQTNDKSEIKSLLVELIYESPEPLGKSNNGEGYYYRSVWKKHFVPNNIQFQDLNN